MSWKEVRLYKCSRCGVEVVGQYGTGEPEGWYCNGQLNYCPACHKAFDEFMGLGGNPVADTITNAKAKQWKNASPEQPENGTLQNETALDPTKGSMLLGGATAIEKAKERVESWDCWGNEVESDIEL